MAQLTQAISRFFNPAPGPEAIVAQRQAERLETAAQKLAEHHDVFAELVRDVQRRSGGSSVPRQKASKRAKT